MRSARSAGDVVQIPVLGGLGSLAFGKSPEEVENWSYGNMPMTVPQMTRVPQFKKGRAESLADTAFAAPMARPFVRAATSLPSSVGRAAADFAMAGSPVHVVKPKGGNWLAGSVERAIEPMRTRFDMGAGLRVDPATINRENLDARQLEMLAPSDAMNRWLETKLAKYIKNEMATPEDPIRALAERGVLHVAPEQVGLNRYRAPESRLAAGYPEQGLGQSEAARAWEAASDVAIFPRAAAEVARAEQLVGRDVPDWMRSVPPETPVYSVNRNADDLGFGHLVDELRNAVNPESGLPASLRLKYQDLEKVTVPQAVERVAKINDWRAAQKAEADMARAMGPATQVVKEYPEQGFKWVELRQPKETGRKISVEKSEMDLPPDMDQRQMREVAEDMAFDEGFDEGTPEFNNFVRDMMTDFNRKKKVEMDESYKALEDALKYEGEVMGHCVGGYCPDVVEGRSKIYSLRDKKGQPHVTIEVQPGKKKKLDKYSVREVLTPEEAQKYFAAADDPSVTGTESQLRASGLYETVAERLGLFDEPPMDIVQIKGKGNKAPKEDYLPAVQDFVRSGNWGKIGDLKNTGLVQLPDKRLITKEQFEEGVQRLTGEGGGPGSEWFMNVMRGDPSWWEESKGAFEGFAQGGLVSGANFPTDDFDPARIGSIVDELHAMNAG
jgi:hypothetical protein